MRKLAITVALTLSASSALAGGLILNDHGAKATGRANAVVATVKDGSSIFYNPAGIALADGYNIYLGGTLILPYAGFTEEGTGTATDAERPKTVTPNFYAYGEINDVFKVGFGFFTPFGSSSAWPESSPGRDQSRNSTLRTFFLVPTLGVNMNKWVKGLAVGLGFDLVPADVDLNRDILFGDVVGTARLGGDGLGFGGRIGVQYHPIDQLSIGLTYRSKVKLKFTGQGDFDIEAPYRAALPPDGPIDTEVTLPQTVLGGVAYRPMPNLEIEFNFNWNDWSDYDSIDIELADGSTTSIVNNWDPVLVLKLGAEYTLPAVGAAVRGGYSYDPTPVPAETLGFAPPDADRHVVHLGGSYQLPKGMWVDLGILYGLPVTNKTSDEPLMPQIKGEFDITFFVAALSLGYSWGGKKADDNVGKMQISRK